MNKRTFVRRLLALATAAVMLLSAVPAMAAFRDTAGHWAEKTITEWQEQGLIDGYSDGGFHPNASVTRAEFVKLLNRALNFTAESAISFTDVKESDWFYAEAAKAAAAGYAQGSNGAFRPEQAITRAEAAAMIARAVSLTADEKRADAFADAAAIPAWAKGSVGAAAESGYMNGYPDGTFGAGNFITRAEAVVTLDRVRKDAQSVTVEKAGTTLEDETVAGNLIVAASVGEGNVTLKHMTIRGDLIVRGGGANSVYLDGTKVGGSVQMQKENVHLRLMGDTTLGSVEISQPCRITQDDSFKGALGTVVIDLEKDSSKEIQIEVPAERVEVVSRANVALNADVEKLVLSADAEGAQLEIKRGATVGELTADAKAKLTGSGTVSSLVVSASDVTVSDSLSVKKTETTDGAKEPTVSGGSSGSSGRALKEITGIAPITAEVPYGTSEADALKELPAAITLNVKDGSIVQAAAAGWSWADGVTYDGTTAGNYKAETTFTVPSGYTYSGAKTATATVTVKALDTSTFDKALTAAKDLQRNLTTDEAAAAADSTKILITDKATGNVTKDVRFTTDKAKATLESAIAAAESAAANFASQKECTDQTTALTAAVKAFKDTIKTGENATTDAYILQQVKEMLSNCDSAAYTKSIQPLKYNYTYRLYKDDGWAVPSSDVRVKIDWSASGSGESYVSIGDTDEQAKDEKNQHWSYGAKIKAEPTEPTEITFTAKITRNDTNAVVGTIDYTVTVGAPISVSEVQPKVAPQIAPITPNDDGSHVSDTCTVQINLNGAEAIKSVKIKDEDSALITMEGLASPSSGDDITTISPELKSGTANDDGLNLTVSIATGPLSGVWNPNNDENPAHSTGRLTNISINPKALELYPFGEKNPGWYLPTTALNPKDIDVYLLKPAFTKVQTDAMGDSSQVKVTLTTQYMPENAYIRIALALSSVGENAIDTDAIIVTASLVSGETGKYEAVFDGLTGGTTYKIWYQFGRGGNWVDTKTTLP